MSKLALLFGFLLFSIASTTTWKNKVNPYIFKSLESPSSTTSYIIRLQNYDLDTSEVPPLNRPRYVFEKLTSWSSKTQVSLKNLLQKANVEFTPYWITNIITTTTNISVLMDVAAMDEVLEVEPNKEFRVPLEKPDFIDENENQTQKRQTEVIEWNLSWINAPTVWNTYGYRGDGFVIANADTGVAWNHPALIQQYRGYNNNNPDHNYNWWDAIHNGGSNRCGLNSQQPCDDNGHGTHTTGTAVGFNHAGYYIGVAPGAKWIACRNMNAGLGTPTRYIECLQFFVAPTDLNGENPNPDLAPHSIGNSYGCPPSEGCSTGSLFDAVTNVVNAGIFMSVSAGNSGPSCSTVSDPPSIYDNVCSVGATGSNTNTIASYSSRGPVTVDSSGLASPNIVAPGSSVRSSYPPTGYAVLSGTSMASPAVTGSIPLLWEAKPEYIRKPLETRSLLEDTANPISFSGCSSSGSPNNVYGHGVLDISLACAP